MPRPVFSSKFVMAVATFVALDVRDVAVFVYVPFSHPLCMEVAAVAVWPRPLRNPMRYENGRPSFCTAFVSHVRDFRTFPGSPLNF